MDEIGAITDVAGTLTPTGGSAAQIPADTVISAAGQFCPAASTSAPYYHMPSIAELPSTVPAPAPTPVAVTPVALAPADLTTAATEIATALAAVPAADAAPPPPPREIKSAMTFPVAVADIAVDTPERTEFEDGFKTQMAAALGGGTAVAAADIIIDGITAGSVVVAFHIVVPQAVTQAATNMFATLKADTTPIEISVGGVAHSAAPSATMTAPTVMEIPAQDCMGVFVACDTDCKFSDKIECLPSIL